MNLYVNTVLCMIVGDRKISMLVGWLCLTSHRQRGHLQTAPPILLSLAKLNKYTVPTGN